MNIEVGRRVNKHIQFSWNDTTRLNIQISILFYIKDSVRRIGQVIGYSNSAIRGHIQKLTSDLTVADFNEMFVLDRYYAPTNKMYCDEYWISRAGLKELKKRWSCYERARSIYGLLTEIHYQEQDKLTPEQEKPKAIHEVINLKEENGEILISGRELHEFLEIGTRYDIWFTRMCEYGFEENQDFALLVQKRTTNNPKNPTTTITDHAMKIDMAKEISMLQRNDKGKEARKYFIDCEKKLKAQQPPQPVLPTNFKEALMMLVSEVEAKEALQLEVKAKDEVIEVMQPKSEYCDMVLKADGTASISVIAKQYGKGSGLVRDIEIRDVGKLELKNKV